MPTSTLAPFPPLPRPVQLTIAGLSLLTLLSALAMALAAAILPPTPVWVLTGFEVVIALAGLMGLLGFKGRFDDGQALFLTCIAGTLFVAGFLSYLGTRQGVNFQTTRPAYSILPWMFGRLGLSALFLLFALYSVLRRGAAPRGSFLRFLIASALLGLLFLPFALSRGLPPFLIALGPARFAVLAIVAIAAISLLCAAGHFLIRAFTQARAAGNLET